MTENKLSELPIETNDAADDSGNFSAGCIGCLIILLIIFMLIGGCMLVTDDDSDTADSGDEPSLWSSLFMRENGLTPSEEDKAIRNAKDLLAVCMNNPSSAEFLDVAAERRDLLQGDKDTGKDIIAVTGRLRGTTPYGIVVEHPFKVMLSYPGQYILRIEVGDEMPVDVLDSVYNDPELQKEW